jgi:two-component system NtrC family sensor kinase
MQLLSAIRRRARRIGVGVRLAVLVAVALAAAAGVFVASSVILQRRDAMVAVRRDARRLVESLEATLRVQMLRGDSHRLGEAVVRLARPEGVAAVALSDHRGVVRYATRVAEICARAKIGDRACAGARHAARSGQPRSFVIVEERRELATAVMPIRNEAACARACHVHSPSLPMLGLLSIEVPYAQVAAALRRYALEMLALSLALALATLVVVLFAARRWVSRPAARLVEATRRVAGGDLSQRISVGEAELGELAQAFNRMQEQIADGQRQVVAQAKLASMGKLAASVAHEINNPLSGILTFSEELYEQAAPDDPLRADYKVIYDEALRCREIVRDLLEFGRKGQPRKMRLRVEEAIEDTVRLVARLAPFQNVKIATELDAGLPAIMADPGQLRQVLLNLLVNAAEAMPEGGAIAVRARALAGGGVRISVRDSGHGIPAAIKARVFEPFFSTKGGKTSGLGLAICANIVEQHGGRIEVESEEGEGTTFEIQLPAAGADS